MIRVRPGGPRPRSSGEEPGDRTSRPPPPRGHADRRSPSSPKENKPAPSGSRPPDPEGIKRPRRKPVLRFERGGPMTTEAGPAHRHQVGASEPGVPQRAQMHIGASRARPRCRPNPTARASRRGSATRVGTADGGCLNPRNPRTAQNDHKALQNGAKRPQIIAERRKTTPNSCRTLKDP